MRADTVCYGVLQYPYDGGRHRRMEPAVRCQSFPEPIREENERLRPSFALNVVAGELPLPQTSDAASRGTKLIDFGQSGCHSRETLLSESDTTPGVHPLKRASGLRSVSAGWDRGFAFPFPLSRG